MYKTRQKDKEKSMKKNKRLKITQTIQTHILNNSREYLLVSLIFIIGIFLGVLFINNIKESQNTEITTYLNQFIEKLKNTENLDLMAILKLSILDYTVLAITIWFFGTTVIGIPVVFGMVAYRGFCLGYTISACISIMGFSKGFGFIFITVFLQNIIFIPALLALAVSGFKLYKSIVKDRRKENIKLEIIRHSIFSLLMLIVLCLSSVIEVLVSTNILKNCIQYF